MTDPELLTKLEKKAKVQIARLETQLADAKADAESWRQQCEKAQDMLLSQADETDYTGGFFL